MSVSDKKTVWKRCRHKWLVYGQGFLASRPMPERYLLENGTSLELTPTRPAPLRRKTYGRVFYFWGPMSTYNKPYLTFQQQLELLKSRGLGVTDDAAALSYLGRIGYYRLSAYWYSFRKSALLQDPATKKITVQRLDDFHPGYTFQQALELYVFDKRLRLLVLDAIERIEVAIRVDIAYQLGQHDQFAHTNGALLHGNFSKKVNPVTGLTRHQEWLNKYNQVLARSKEDFVRHYKQKYGLPLPIWVSVEIWEFGMLSTFFQGMTVADKTVIAAKYGIPDFDPLLGKPDITSRLYVILCILIVFMRGICPNSSWPQRLREMLDQFPALPKQTIADMGFPADWETHAFWKERQGSGRAVRKPWRLVRNVRAVGGIE